MSIQWTVIAGYLYFEVAIVIIMLLPIFSPRRWNQFFKSRIFSMFQKHAASYFYVLLGVLSMFLLDAMREMRKYSNSEAGAHANLSSEMKGSVKLFRAQRNFYITGSKLEEELKKWKTKHVEARDTKEEGEVKCEAIDAGDTKEEGGVECEAIEAK